MPTDRLARNWAAQAKAGVALVELSLDEKSMLGERLRRAASRALSSNPVMARPWLAAADYAASTAYLVGDVVKNGNALYAVGIAGTSPASGGAPTQLFSGQFTQYGGSGPHYTYLGGNSAADPGDGAPVVTFSSSDPGLGMTWDVNTHDVFSYRGGDTTIAWQTNHRLLQTFTNPASGVVSYSGVQSFVCDDDIVAIKIPAIPSGASRGSRIIVADRYLQIGNYSVAPGTDKWVRIDWRTAGSGRKPRVYEIEPSSLSAAVVFGNVQTSIRGMIHKHSVEEIKVAAILDSYGQGASYGPFLGGGQLPHALGRRLGWTDVRNMSIGGTGYLNPGTGANTYRGRIAEALAMAPDIFMLFGSLNDAQVAYPALDVQAEALLTYQTIRAGTRAPIIVCGLPPVNSSYSAIVAREQALAAAVTQFNDPLTFFVPITTAPVPWILGAWNNTAITGTPVNAPMYIGGDSIHPVDAGTAYFAALLDLGVREIVLPQI